MARNKFTLLFIRNDSNVKRLKVSPSVFILVTSFAALLITLGVSGSYLGYLFWSRYQDLRVLHSSMEKELTIHQKKLGRLQNLEQFLRSFDPEKLNILLDDSMTSGTGKETAPIDRQSVAELVPEYNAGIVQVEGIRLKQESDMYRLTFSVHNTDPPGPAGGSVELFLHTTTGGMPLDSSHLKGDLRFLIRNFKTMDIRFSLPQELEIENVTSLRLVVVDNEGTAMFSKSYLISQILN